ncbi:hypothetical protein SAMN00120144_1207 [Hymenobacter roseosalivarius DSM 11622]|uniref:DUF3806 domain-containing protein n=1 Tax=Hymenobacter roseosalivarius DSM 11622 TaxID=645990 RepID=A0A1W1V4P8_9BACT|nr:hypothetical protein [Hymenobacter roseosalivarius]SMB88296.1 hypothetical protein SAMN00120144_1207 [Hymenobacter roseosalivarius DSM 11622]
MPPESPLPSLRAAADAVRQQLQVNAFDATGVQRLSDFIEAERAGLPATSREGVISALGCFLGECLVQTYQGEWATGPDGTTGVGLRNKLFFNPFYRIEQQLTQGTAESVVTFFTRIPARLAAEAPRKNWI